MCLNATWTWTRWRQWHLVWLLQILHWLWPVSELVPRALRGHPAERGRSHRRVRVSPVPVHRGCHDCAQPTHWQRLWRLEEGPALLAGEDKAGSSQGVDKPRGSGRRGWFLLISSEIGGKSKAVPQCQLQTCLGLLCWGIFTIISKSLLLRGWKWKAFKGSRFWIPKGRVGAQPHRVWKVQCSALRSVLYGLWSTLAYFECYQVSGVFSQGIIISM